MGYFWIFIYVLFVIFIVTFFSWSTIILQKQKRAWAVFAKRHNLNYRSNRFMDPSAVNGQYQGYQIGLFSEAQIDNRGRGVMKYRTIIEVLFGEGMPTKAAIGNENAMGTINALNFGPTYHPKNTSWNNNHIITSADRKFIEAYLTNERLERLNSFLKMKQATAMFVFDDVDAFLRVETADPMMDADKIDKFINKLIPLAQTLQLSRAEGEKYIVEREPEITEHENAENETIGAEETPHNEDPLPEAADEQTAPQVQSEDTKSTT